jgi:dynein light chain LC8-type
MTERNLLQVINEMDEKMFKDVEEQVNRAIDAHETEKLISEYIKNFFDKKYSPNWHVVVGKHFASYVTHQVKHYCFFYIGQLAILIYKL